MHIKTHLAIGAFAGLFFLPHVNHKLLFLPVVLIASILPDIDSGFINFFRGGLKWQEAHKERRGMFHSLTLCVLITIILAFYAPILSLPFFLGYAVHLVSDSWTLDGTRPFWPLKHELKGRVREGNLIERTVFLIFIALDAILLVLLLFT